MPTFRRLDLDQLWRRTAGLGLNPQTLARHAGLQDGEMLANLRGLQELTAAQLVALADVLEVTVDELLTIDDPADDASSATTTRDTSGPRHAQGTPDDADILQAALLRFSSLPEQAVTSATEWTDDHLDTVITEVHRRWASIGLRVRRTGGRLELEITRDLPDWLKEKFVALWLDTAVLGPQEASFLAVAIRAHAAGIRPGPMMPWHVGQTLARQGAVTSAGRHAVPGQPVRLAPHPDLLFALHLADEPAPAPHLGNSPSADPTRSASRNIPAWET